jgi:hypothetical protein
MGVGDEKTVHDAYSGVPNRYETDNFSIWWGDNHTMGQTHIEKLGSNFEVSWQAVVEELGYPQPVGTSETKFNVYIGDTGNGTPSAEGAVGYFWYAPDGSPMIVIDKSLVKQPDSAKLTAGHEFFHAVQDAVDTYTFSGNAQWWYEATSNWILTEIYPTNGGYASTLYGVALRPEFPVNHFGYPYTGACEDDHHYGAFIFALYLSENHGGSDIIYDSWLSGSAGGDPLDVVDDLLKVKGTTLTDAHLDYAFHNATWNYKDEDNLEWFAEAYVDDCGDHRDLGTIGATSEWARSSTYAPRTYGVNYWRLDELPEVFTLEFEGEGGAEWQVGLAWQTGSSHSSLVMDDPDSTFVVRDWVEPGEAWLVIGAIDTMTDDGSHFDYQVRIHDGELMEEDSNLVGEEGCGCNTPALAPSFLGLLGLVGLCRRRE